MILDRNGKLFGKVSIVDLLAALVVLVAVIGIGARFFTSASDNVRGKTQLSYVVEFENVRMYSIDALNHKGIATDTKSGAVIGEIVNVEYEPYKTHEITASGDAILAEVPERYIARITLNAEGNETAKGYFVGDNIELSVGGSVAMSTKYVNTNGRVISIEKR